ncbi:hypothetical protein [Hydrogenophaga sp. NFH-34]|uniref:hypothetical protein n=1 Tax=Hydrogenophaga sp. NFH-34 TaxID=2744446 RepID=UPI001F37B625|nr:hypothetical protein [Hydrogenophaga sp. NFH-34]
MWMLNALLLVDLVLQVNLARTGMRKVFELRKVPPELAYVHWHACLKWWSFLVPSGYLALAAIGWVLKAAAQGQGATASFGGFLGAFSLIMALVAASRLLSHRDTSFEKSEWSIPLK